MRRKSKSRHGLGTLLLVNGLIITAFLAAGEMICRYYVVHYNVDYYSDGRRDGSVIHHPYGTIPVNSLGFNDAEFDLDSRKSRVGWFGDSVNYGLGAGYPYRVSDIFRRTHPEMEHWNVGAGIDTGIDENVFVDKAKALHLDHVVHLLNLNDIVPPQEVTGAQSPGLVFRIRQYVLPVVDVMRTHSYLYNYTRFLIKNAVQRLGYEASGYFAYELWPHRDEAVFAAIADRLNREAGRLHALGVTFCVVILPYEMQVSKAAAERYRELGFRWEDGFETGSAQAMLRKYLAPDLPVYDARGAFAPYDWGVGETFVYDKGDKIDWNHPNRKGHALIAAGLDRARACPFQH